MKSKYDKYYFEKYAILSLALCYDKQLLQMYCDQNKYESPDFQSQALGIGLEVTEAITAKQGEERFIINQYFGKGTPGKQVIEKAEKRFGRKIKGKIYSVNDIAVYSEHKGLYDFSIHRGLIKEKILVKTIKLNSNYKLFNNNWLYIYANTSLLITSDIVNMLLELQLLLKNYVIKFDKIFINNLNEIFVITKLNDISSISVDKDTLIKIKRLAFEK